MSPPLDLIKAIRSGHLSEVVAALDSGAEIELHDGKGGPGLPLAIACFMGHAEIVRELGMRGAQVNLADNRAANSPLAMAVRSGKLDVVTALIELGAEVPPDMKTGLAPADLTMAKWKGQHFASTADGKAAAQPEIEEIDVIGCYGTDTSVLNAEMRRTVQEKCSKPVAPLIPRR